ncbi:MAG: TonB-dependent siderophore receptor [Cyanobacteria bacterium P01_H01_bin.119]
MEKSLSGLPLLVLLSLASGQILVIETALAQPELEAPEAEAAERLGPESENSLAQAQPQLVEPEETIETRRSEPFLLLSETPVRLSGSAEASTVSSAEPLTVEASRRSQLATTVTDWVAQIEDALVQVTDVRLEVTEAGVQVLLETVNGELAAPTQTVSGNALILEISNAVLIQGAFEQFDPVDGIALVQVTALPGDRVQVVITGTDAAPTVEVNAAASALTVTAVPGVAQAGEDDEALQIVVTGEQGSRYYAPDTTTATRTDTPLRDIPQSIQVIPQEVLEDQGVIRLNDALRNVSGAAFAGNNGTGQRFILRGFEDPAILRDGYRLTFGGFGNPGFPELSNVETIEVLKGPASIVFGSVEPGGVINFVTEQPLSEPSYELGLRIGNQGLIEPSLDLSGPLTEDGRLHYRLNVLHRREDYFRDFTTDVTRTFIAPVISWQISDNTDLTVSLEYVDSETPSDLGLVAVGDGIADIPFERVLGEPDDFNQTELIRVGYDFEHRFSDNWQFRNAFRFTSFDLSSAFLNLGIVDPAGDTISNFFFSDQENNNLELQTNMVGEFNTGAIEHTLLFGFDYFRYANPRLDRISLFPFVTNNIFNPVYGTVPRPERAAATPAFDSENSVEAYGIYIQDQIELADNLLLLAGIRYETVRQELVNNQTLFVPASVRTFNEAAFSPRLGVVYQPIEELSLYGSFSRSFVPNIAQTSNLEIIPPERGEQFEVGARAELLDGRVIANIAFFNLTKRNVANPDPNNTMFSVATGEQRSRGIELDIAGEILPGWNIIANYAYTDADITEDNTGIEGNRLYGVPENNFNLWTTYDIQSGALEGLGFGLGFNYVDERFGNNANDFMLDSYFLTNAAISYQRDNWQAAINIRNLFDVNYIEGSRNSRTFGITPGAGFTLIGSFSIEF